MQLFDCKRFRKSKDLTQAQLAEFLGCNQSFIASIEAGARPMPREMISKISASYEDAPDYIITIEDSSPQIVQRAKNGDNINGTHVEVTKSDSAKFLDVILQQSAQLSKSQEQLSKSQEQIDRLISLIEQK
jgi:transcriptional regulator with XRE-family HTH domain